MHLIVTKAVRLLLTAVSEQPLAGHQVYFETLCTTSNNMLIHISLATAHSGKNSIKVAGAGGYCGHIFFGTTQVPTGDLYVRTWL